MGAYALGPIVMGQASATSLTTPFFLAAAATMLAAVAISAHSLRRRAPRAVS
jgi:hypothetical protein